MGYNYNRGRATPDFTIKTIWGIAKSPELLMSDEDLYSIIYRETGKDSMRKLTQKEIGKICFTLLEIKDSVSGKSKTGRTDTGGNKLTIDQRRKIYKLTGELGWNNNNARINGFVKKMFNTERLEWLNKQQCNNLIEMLKSMVERENSKKGGGSDSN
ncbi:regulatory protein GemA [Tissierella carlieri]|uniref:regulatory protein GemA n=1 Tax=Tissierella carlieri TaxID=689904 RepID=UPI001C0F6138|nr:regulatory protein GemA [Tissierella carlieri]MBU5312240.1 regulatory protein GemA [Tissierella carlieri]